MLEPSTGKVTVSIVSHGHGAEVSELISRLVELRDVALIVLTWNLGFEECSIPEHSKILVVIVVLRLGSERIIIARANIVRQSFFAF